MDKSPDAFRTISEVADWLGTPTHVLRFWESRFAQVKPVKRAGGRRYYRPADMALLGGIKKLLHEDGLTIRGVQKILREEGVKHVAALSPQIDGQQAAAIAVDVPPAPEPDNVVQMTPAPASEPAADPSAPDAGAAEAPVAEPETTVPAPAPDAPESPEKGAEVSADDAEPPAPTEPVAPESTGESPPGAPPETHMPAFLLTGMTDPAPARGIGEDAPPEPSGAAIQAPTTGDGTAPAPPEPEPEPDVGPTPAETILARLDDGASADPAALRPIYDRLAALRQRMSGAARP